MSRRTTAAARLLGALGAAARKTHAGRKPAGDWYVAVDPARGGWPSLTPWRLYPSMIARLMAKEIDAIWHGPHATARSARAWARRERERITAERGDK